jgi:hypothetical protein
VLLAEFSLADNPPSVSLDVNEPMFTVLAAINTCGYNQELGVSDPLRAQVRTEIKENLQDSSEAQEATKALCQFYEEHQQPDASRTLSQYVSLALYLGPAPGFVPKVKQAELPPDAVSVLGVLPLLQNFYLKAGLHTIWERHHTAYLALTERYHEALAKMTFNTEVYLKLPSAGYLGRQFTVYIDPMGAPGQVNARNYGSDYYVVISPGTGSSLKMDQIRHTYLHYLLDPFALKYPALMDTLRPLLESVKGAPMDASFKRDISLLVTESFIRAIEARTAGTHKASDEDRDQAVENSMTQGYVLTRFFYDSLAGFEKDPVGLHHAYVELIGSVDVHKEEKRAAGIHFAANADPELLHFSRPSDNGLLVEAQQRLTAGDADSARKMAEQALNEKTDNPGRAWFILAQVATMNRDLPGAREYFLKALDVAQEPKVVAWSHIYLGRIFDLQENRPLALDHYRAALSAGSSLPEARAAAERGLQQPYEPPSRPQ